MQRKSLNASKSGFSEHRKLSKKIPNCQRSKTVIADRTNLPKISNRSRLVDGANISQEFNTKEVLTKISSESVQKVVSFSPSVTPTSSLSPIEKSVQEYASSYVKDKNSHDKQPFPANDPHCFSQISGSIGNRKVDEIIEYVHQNIKEAGEALVTLGENFEHDLKSEH